MKINNQEIYIFDNVYESHHTQKFYDFIIKSYFMIDLNDSNTSDYHNEKSFGAKYSMDDISNMGIVKYLPNNIKEKFNISMENCDRGLVNAITSSGVYHPHDDSGNGAKWSFLYYANMKWDLEWGGDTLFLNDDRQTINNVVQCKPNRVVIFDATIPHLIRPSTNIAPQFRFSVNMTFKDKNETS
tara:strand:+ start:136 stop:690 length:555 start_codon:yes stop_codon:yes gene_type:complete